MGHQEVTGPPFYFMTAVNEYTGVTAVSLRDLYQKVQRVDVQSLEFHVSRRDFQRWIRDRWQLDALVDDLNAIRERGIRGECLRHQLRNVVALHLAADDERAVIA
jgi:hypothetical protein